MQLLAILIVILGNNLIYSKAFGVRCLVVITSCFIRIGILQTWVTISNTGEKLKKSGSLTKAMLGLGIEV